MNDYARIARVIEYLDTHHAEQPDLAALAEHAGLSSFHFHRLFSTWAGVTPKDFLQSLTLNHARELLRNGESILNSSLAAGLSGPGRLHDLCIHLEAASPGEIKAGGAGLEIQFGFAETPFGTWLAAETTRGICHIEFVDGDAPSSDLQQNWPRAKFKRDDVVARRLASTVFDSTNKTPTLRAFVRGTDFQVQVWRALLKIPTGALTSYGRLANSVGHPNAARAVGSAVGRNPIAYLIPCHRVIRETGIVKGYRWGNTRKRALLAWEYGR